MKGGVETEIERRRDQHLVFDSCISVVHHPAGNNRDVVGLEQQTHTGTSKWEECHLDQRYFSIKLIYISIFRHLNQASILQEF